MDAEALDILISTSLLIVPPRPSEIEMEKILETVPPVSLLIQLGKDRKSVV